MAESLQQQQDASQGQQQQQQQQPWRGGAAAAAVQVAPQPHETPRRRAQAPLGPGRGCAGGTSNMRLLLYGCTSMAEVEARNAARERAAEVQDAALRDPSIPPAQKHALHTAHLFEHGRSPFACPRCWLLAGTCICGRLPVFEPSTEVGPVGCGDRVQFVHTCHMSTCAWCVCG